MSKKKITFVYKDKEKEVGILANVEECKKAFQNEFSLSDKEMANIVLYYIDEDGDKDMINSNEDYNLFLDSQYDAIQGEANEQEKPDPMRSATIFKKKGDESYMEISKNDSYNKDNSISLENSANIDIILGKNNLDGLEEGNIHEVNNLMDKVAEEKIKEKTIAELKEQMEQLKLKHEEELKRKEEENQKKYTDALAKKETEIKKKIEEEKEKQLKEYKINPDGSGAAIRK